VRSFSKGLQQRLGLAVALVGDPALILLDEPTSALDPIGRYEVSLLLQELRAQGTTVFLNSHLLSDVEKVCDSVALIDAGRVLYQGSLKDALYGGTRHYRLLVENLTQASWAAVHQSYPAAMVQWDGKGGAEISVRAARTALPGLNAQLVEAGVRVYEVAPDHSSLEEWFLSRLGKDPQ
jgi:ABC-2 type transport system ATP-binding protein